jgi:uncharacterized protein (DUF427 family)
MITNTGKDILGKYLLGQVPGYAAYISCGSGQTPLPTDEPITADYSEQKSLEFETARVPIVSRGYVVEDSQKKIVFTAELPTQERYEISEIGVFSAKSNPAAKNADSRMLYSFSQNEGWEYHQPAVVTQIPVSYDPLDQATNDGNISGQPAVFHTNANNRIFNNAVRLDRYERPRFLDNYLAIVGNMSTLSYADNRVAYVSGNHIHLQNPNLSLDKNSPTDELRIAFSVLNRDVSGTFASVVPDSVRIVVEFAFSEAVNSEYARFELNLDNGTAEGEYDFVNNRYVVAKKQLQELFVSNGFGWSGVRVVKIYASTILSGVASDRFYVALDGIRFENLTNTSPVYGLTGYSVVRTENSETIVKRSNTSSFVEFRFAIGVD